jgi:hypothetical protein
VILEGEEMLLYSKINDLPEPETFGVNNLLNLLKTKPFPIGGPGVDSWGKFRAMPEDPMPIWSQSWRFVRTIFWDKESDKVHLDLVTPSGIKVDGLARWVYNEGLPFWDVVCFKWDHFWNPVKGLPQPSPGSPPRRCSSALGATLVQWLSDLRRKMSNANQESEKSKDAVGEESITITYRKMRLMVFAYFITTVFGIAFSLLPVIAIMVLSSMHKLQSILGFIALFTGLFTVGLTLLTPWGQSRIEIFAATAA